MSFMSRALHVMSKYVLDSGVRPAWASVSSTYKHRQAGLGVILQYG